ncbi:S49 family peptidase [Desulfovibrio sp. ZJ369]|uniref:S49 family peptidase n=1 Tax=Desulfovibrio sp. ZJ369 TaxID=2709793 RepID=UPI0013EB7E1D|nr:S49 family peptidase [Desulfovibrio sp. ZJ369]
MSKVVELARSHETWAIAREYAPTLFAALQSELEQRKSPEALSQPPHEDAARSVSERLLRVVNGVAVISIGAPLDSTSLLSRFSDDILMLGHDAIREAVKMALADTDVRSILLSIDSPGGVVQGTKELADFLAEAARQKPLAAYANGLCASAAFWLASACGRIYAPATALVGSIGVIMCVSDWSEFYANMGVKLEYISSGRFKAAGREGKPLSEEERAYFQGQLDTLHDIFRQDVRERLSLETPESAWAEAQLIVASQAQPLGLVSRIVRDEEEAINLLAEEKGMSQITREVLAKDAPELLAEIQASARAEGKAEGEAQAAKAADEARAQVMTLIRAVAGEEVTAKVEQLAKAGVTPAQLAALAPLLGREKAETSPADNTSESDARKQMLEAIASVTGGPLPSGADVRKSSKSALVADAERRAAAQRMM